MKIGEYSLVCFFYPFFLGRVIEKTVPKCPRKFLEAPGPVKMILDSILKK